MTTKNTKTTKKEQNTQSEFDKAVDALHKAADKVRELGADVRVSFVQNN